MIVTVTNQTSNKPGMSGSFQLDVLGDDGEVVHIEGFMSAEDALRRGVEAVRVVRNTP